MKKKNFADVICVIIATIGALFFGAAFLGCYIWAAKHFSVYNLVCAAFASIIPGLLFYGLSCAIIGFLYGEIRWKKKVKVVTIHPVVKNIFTLVLALIAIVIFAGIVVFNFVVAFKVLSFASILAAFLASIIPGVIFYGASVATVEFLRDEFCKKKK